MARRYRRSYNDFDEEDALGWFILFIIVTIINFIIKYWYIIISIVILIIILFLIIKYRKQINSFLKEKTLKKYIKKLKNKTVLYGEIEKLNLKYNFEDLKPLYFSHVIKSKSNLQTCNIDDYMLMNMDTEYEKIISYIKKYKKLTNMYNCYNQEYENLKKCITDEEANKIKMSVKKYNKYQNIIYENLRIKKNYEFKIIVYVNYSSNKGKIKKSRYKIYDKENIKRIHEEYVNIKNTKKINEINSRIERAKMSNSLRHDVFKRDNYRCCICGRTARDGVRLEADHIIPVSKGGKTTMDNLQTLCDRCNNGKSNKL